jgi:predicted  nucleic acid-binding Zn-ribbon protein
LVSKVAERVPGWVGIFLLPEIERVVEKEVNSLRTEMNAKFEAMNTKFEAVNTRLDSIEKRLDLVQDVAVLKAEVKEIREKLATR